jgi:hypothetical protein
VSERESTWKAAVDGVVSDFDVVTRRLRQRQRQALRLAWSAVGVTTLAMGALIALNLPPASSGAPLGRVELALLDPTAPVPVLTREGGTRLLPGIETAPSSPAATAHPSDATAAATTFASAARRTAAMPPAAPPAPVASTSPATVIPPPSPEPPGSSPSAPQALVDALVTGVVDLLS